ncbi:MAG: hypothetical protein Q7J57_11955 [Gemmobacter sp.]|nr:hypothetical protein [Gemmobacter sp.]
MRYFDWVHYAVGSRMCGETYSERPYFDTKAQRLRIDALNAIKADPVPIEILALAAQLQDALSVRSQKMTDAPDGMSFAGSMALLPD